MNDEMRNVFLDLMCEYDPFIPNLPDKNHFRRWCMANAPALVARMIDIMGKADATQKEEANGQGAAPGKPAGRSRRKPART